MVGPNGSGKSNVIDAMLFVFGKRAKQVRFFSFFLRLEGRIDTDTIVSYLLVFLICAEQHDVDPQMRLNKVSELIHNSTNHQNLDSAGVSVHFQEIVDLVFEFFLLGFCCLEKLSLRMHLVAQNAFYI